MRIHFPNGEHDDVSLTSGRVVLGAQPGPGGIVLAGLPAQLALLEVETMRGIWLAVLGASTPLHVNARPVRERAMLRLGDVVMLGGVKMLIKSLTDARESPPPARTDVAAETQFRHLPNRVSLRAVSGQYFGKILHLKARTVIGRGSDCDLVLDEPEMSRRHAIIENTPEGIYLRDLGSANGTHVNGVPVRDTVLRPGDQIAFDLNRFLLEAPGWVPSLTTPTPQPMQQPPIKPVHTQVQRKLVPPPPVAASKPAQKLPVAKPEPSQRWVHWVLVLAALTTLIALAVLIYLSLRGNTP